MTQSGSLMQVLYIDLHKEKWWTETLQEDVVKRYLGGEALSFYLYKKALDEKRDDNPIVLCSGYLSATEPFFSDTLTICGKSADTNLIDSATHISKAATNLTSCNWSAIIISGISRREVVLKIGYKDVQFYYFEALYEATIKETTKILDVKKESALICIGPAGEKKSPLATVISDGSPIERKGFGALFGGKNLKALIFEKGPIHRTPADIELFVKGVAKLKKSGQKSRYFKRLKVTGGFDFIERANRQGFAAVENISKRSDPRLFHLTYKELIRKLGLSYSVKEQSFSELKWNLSREFQIINSYGLLALGSNLGNYEVEKIIKWWNESINLGLHPVSVGMYIAQMIDSDLPKSLKQEYNIGFGKIENVERILKELSSGTIYPFDNNKSTILNRYIPPIDVRGCQTEALLVGLLEDFPLVANLLLPNLKSNNDKKSSEWVVFQENLMALSRSVGLDVDFIVPLLIEKKSLKLRLFGFRRVSLKEITSLVKAMDNFNLNSYNIIDVGKRVLKLKRELNKEVSFPLDIPYRFTFDPESNHPKKVVVPYNKMVRRYRFLRSVDLAKLKEE
ncbi:MAG: aldehyde ferredoxin oxidoreductase N-terminal domain-containing protein [Sphaerochaetaceae bacterium]